MLSNGNCYRPLLIFQFLPQIDNESGTQYTFTDLADSMERIGGALRRRGLKQKDVVCIYSGNSVEFVQLMMATMYAGGTVTTINPTYTAGV